MSGSDNMRTVGTMPGLRRIDSRSQDGQNEAKMDVLSVLRGVKSRARVLAAANHTW
jgi:hypothetical protein